MINIIKRLIPYSIKQNIIYFAKVKENNNIKKFKDKKKIIIMLAANYGNLGDMAITYAQKEFLKNTYPTYEIIEIPISKTYSYLREVKKICTHNDIITIIGGGNMGDLYSAFEMQRQFIISKFKKNKIISFPQTIDFSSTPQGDKILHKASRIYGRHPDLTIIAREDISYKKMKEVFPKNRVILAPDIVLSLNKIEPIYERTGVLLCLRDDKEKYLDNKQQELLLERIHKEFLEVSSYDTHIGEGEFDEKDRNRELEKIWMAFKQSKVVVTDRLHGMIFCYITKTPCVVIPNNNHKVKGSFKWIESCEYIYLCQQVDIEMIVEEIHILYNKNRSELKYIELKDKFRI